MAGELVVKITGIRSIINKLNKIKKTAVRQLTDGLEKELLRVEGTAKRNAPFKSGRLARSITHAIVEQSPKRIRGVIGADTVYARKLELAPGLVHRSKKGKIGKPTKYLFPAIEKNFAVIVKNIRNIVRKMFRFERSQRKGFGG